MTYQSNPKAAVVVLSWNGKDDLPACLDSIQDQTVPVTIIVVDNGSTDGSIELIENKYPKIILLKQSKNLGFAGGVNVGISYALENEFVYIGLLNSDAVVKKTWLEKLIDTLDTEPEVGIVTSKILGNDGSYLDSTGEQYSVWGLPFPRGREEKSLSAYDNEVVVFGASGGASLYRTKLFTQIGLFDTTFFAYYEDIDLSYRAQLAGWIVHFNPEAVTHHQIGASGGKIKGFYAYQTMKNIPMLFWKNTPWQLVPRMFPRMFFAYWLFVGSAFTKGNGMAAIKGNLAWLTLLPHTYKERKRIQKMKTVSDEYIWSIMTHDLPPNAHKLRTLRSRWWKLTRKGN